MASSASGQDETKSRAVIGCPSGQDGALLLPRDCPFCSRNNISPKSKRVDENFLSQNILATTQITDIGRKSVGSLCFPEFLYNGVTLADFHSSGKNTR